MGHTPQFIGGKKERRKEGKRRLVRPTISCLPTLIRKKTMSRNGGCGWESIKRKRCGRNEMWKSHGQHTSGSLTVSVIRLEAGDSRDPEL